MHRAADDLAIIDVRLSSGILRQMRLELGNLVFRSEEYPVFQEGAGSGDLE